MRVTVVLPAYNEEANLGHLLQKFKDVTEDIYNLQLKIIVVNDGSTDNTSAVAQGFGDSLTVEVIENERNLGLADTFMRGMIIASERAHEDDVILCMDADNSHSPGLALRMVRSIQEGRDVVIASRYQPGAVVKGVPLSRRFLSYVMSWLFRLVHPIAGVKDYSCGYRAYRAGFLQKALQKQGHDLFERGGFACMAGLLLALGRSGAICGEVPIILRYDQKLGQSKMKVFHTIMQTLRVLMAKRFQRSARQESADTAEPTT